MDLPSDGQLQQELTVLLEDAAGVRLVRIERIRNRYSSTHPTEFVKCECSDGTHLSLFCKYTAGLEFESDTRHGVQYEAGVYRRLLADLPLPSLRFYGLCSDPVSGWSWIVLESLEAPRRLNHIRGFLGLEAAAEWLGRFHRLIEERNPNLEGFQRNNSNFFETHIQRALRSSEPIHGRIPWFPPLCEKFARECVPLLVGEPTILTHGEFYPSNVLVQDDVIIPVDWESAAVQAAEIDLACLTEGWRKGAEAVRVYYETRWSSEPPARFPVLLDVARLHVNLTWLAEGSDWTDWDSVRHRFDRIHEIALRLHLTTP